MHEKPLHFAAVLSFFLNAVLLEVTAHMELNHILSRVGSEPDVKNDCPKFGVLPPKRGSPKVQFSCGFTTTSRLKREYLRKKKNYWQTANRPITQNHSIFIRQRNHTSKQKREIRQIVPDTCTGRGRLHVACIPS